MSRLELDTTEVKVKQLTMADLVEGDIAIITDARYKDTIVKIIAKPGAINKLMVASLSSIYTWPTADNVLKVEKLKPGTRLVIN